MTRAFQETGEYGWYLDAYQSVKNSFGFRADLSETDPDANSRNFVQFGLGQLPYDEMPERLWVRGDAPQQSNRKLPHFIQAGSYFAVSAQVAGILERHDMGSNLLKPVELLKHDRTTPFAGEWFLFQVAEKKTGFEIDVSENYKLPKRRYPPEDGHIATILIGLKSPITCRVNASVLSGAEVWEDTLLRSSLFVSDGIVKDLMQSDLLGPVSALRCPVIAA